jgi:hypothetical protein
LVDGVAKVAGNRNSSSSFSGPQLALIELLAVGGNLVEQSVMGCVLPPGLAHCFLDRGTPAVRQAPPARRPLREAACASSGLGVGVGGVVALLRYGTRHYHGRTDAILDSAYYFCGLQQRPPSLSRLETWNFSFWLLPEDVKSNTQAQQTIRRVFQASRQHLA